MPSRLFGSSRFRRSRLALSALVVTACGGAAVGLAFSGPSTRPLDGPRQTQLARLHAARAQGLDPARYEITAIEAARARGASQVELDALLDEGLARLRTDLLRGATPDDRRPAPFRDREVVDGRSDDPLPLPLHPEYHRLVEWLAIYERRARDGGWPRVGDAPRTALEVGDTDPAVGRLRARLAASPDPTEARDAGRGAGEADHFDPNLEQAVRHAQARFGLEADGVVGEATWAALSVRVDDRIAALRTTLERWRWLPRTFGSELTLWVDVPSFELSVLEGEEPILVMPVVVGSPDTPTPSLADTLQTVVVHPYWNVPESIVLNELAPAQAADPGHLAAGGYEVLDGTGADIDPSRVDWSRSGTWPAGLRVRQRPGPGNALGTIKFLFPNHEAVYLHDSPARHLYDQADRALSHGCVRLADAWALAELLAERGVIALDVTAARQDPSRRPVGVRRSVPVFFTHFAARATEAGRAPRFSSLLPGDDLSGAEDRS